MDAPSLVVGSALGIAFAMALAFLVCYLQERADQSLMVNTKPRRTAGDIVREKEGSKWTE